MKFLSIDCSTFLLKRGDFSKKPFQKPDLYVVRFLFLRYFGLDRFPIGDWGKGIIKLLTGGGPGIWYIIDWFLIVRATKRKNMERLEEIINHP